MLLFVRLSVSHARDGRDPKFKVRSSKFEVFGTSNLGSRFSRATPRFCTKELIGDCLDIWYSARRLNLRETREKSGKGATGKMGGNFESRFSRQSRPSRLSQGSVIAAEVFMNHAG